MSDKDGGSAFPTLETETYHPQFGMSLRDYFAALAMQGMNASPELLQVVTGGSILDGTVFERMAANAYRQADAMLTERAKDGAA